MCLAVPAEVKKIQGHEALLDYGGGVKRKANVSLIEDLKVGDYVIVHVGFAIQKLDREAALETLKLWDQILEEEDS